MIDAVGLAGHLIAATVCSVFFRSNRPAYHAVV